jgi:hypothetical protein
MLVSWKHTTHKMFAKEFLYNWKWWGSKFLRKDMLWPYWTWGENKGDLGKPEYFLFTPVFKWHLILSSIQIFQVITPITQLWWIIYVTKDSWWKLLGHWHMQSAEFKLLKQKKWKITRHYFPYHATNIHNIIMAKL